MTAARHISLIAPLAILSLVLCVGLRAQNQFVNIDATNLNSIVRYMPQGGGYDYTYNGTNGYSIGRADGTNGMYSGSQEDLYVCQRQFDLSVLPVNATVVNVTLTVGFGNYANGTYQATVVALSSIRSYGQGWGDVWSGSAYFQNIPYGSPQPQSHSTFTNAVRNAGRGYFYVGLKGQSGTNGSYATLTQARLTIEYTPPVQVTVRTNLPGNSTVKVDGGSYSSPASFSWVSGSPHTLESTSQPPNTFQTWFNVTAGQEISGNPISVSPTSNTIYEARYDVNYQVTVQNSFGAGFVTVDGNQYASGTQFTWSAGSQHSLLATNQTFNNYLRVFCKWRTPGGDVFTNPITVAANASGSYEADMPRQFDVAVTQAQYIEPGSGGTYKVNGTNVGSTWQGTYVENCSSPILLEAVPPSSDWLFVQWSDGVTLNPRDLVPTDHVNGLNAMFKKHLSSSSSSATGPSNQRKTITFAGTTHLVYTSGASIWYSHDNGSGWTNEVLVSGSATSAKNPAIAIPWEGIALLNVVWEEDVNCGTTRRVVKYARSSDMGTTWQAPLSVSSCYTYDRTGGDALPVIASLTSRVAVVWKCNGALIVKMDPISNHNPDVFSPVPGTDATSDQPSLWGAQGPFKLAFKGAGGHTMYREFTPNLDYTVSYGTLADVSNPFAVSNPSITCTVLDQRVFVSWDADVAGGGHHVFVSERDPSTGWRTPVEFTHGSDVEVNSSTYINEGVNQVYVSWEANGHAYYVSRALASSTWRPVHDMGIGASPTNPAWAGGSDGTARSVRVTGASSPFTISTFTLLPPAQISAGVLNGWNMTGIPLAVFDFSKAALYPTATSAAFAYNNGYVVTDPLSNNRGWFIKFGAAQNITYEGDWITYMPMVANSGWNIIGSISTPIQTPNVYSNPPNIVISPFYRYENGYIATTVLQPGGGYWVNTNAAGYIILDANAGQGGEDGLNLAAYDKFTIEDAAGGVQDLYVRNGELTQSTTNIEMPPSPPDSLFDVRFASGDFVKTVFPDSGSTSLFIALNDVVYPVQLTWSIRSENGITYTLTADTGSGFGKVTATPNVAEVNSLVIPRRGNGVVQLSTTNPRVLMRPGAFALHQNYPNPFNPTTDIRFDLADPGNVSLVVYDILGKKVADLVGGYLEAGYHSTTWNASDLSSGVYFARFSVTNVEGKTAFAKVNKLVLMK